MGAAVRTHLVAVCSDIHFPHHHPAAWEAFKTWAKDTKPALVVFLGDLVDLAQLSQYPMDQDANLVAVEEFRLAAREMNTVAAHCADAVFLPGNHEARYAKALVGAKAPFLKGLVGLSLIEQLRAQGLSSKVRYVAETAECPGLWIGKPGTLLARHGDKQAGKYGAVNVALKIQKENPGVSQIVGHHHRAQLSTQTVLGKTSFYIANPHLSGSHEYNTSPDWQRGFTALEFFGRGRLRDCVSFTPHLVVMDSRGRFSWGGRPYG